MMLPDLSVAAIALVRRIGLALALLFLSFSAHAAYVPPIGIPTPSFGIEQTVASVYGSNTYYTYWIDNTHPNATDTDNLRGSPAKPRMTVPAVIVLGSGDVVQIRGTNYLAFYDRWYFYATGTVTRPIFITGGPSGPVANKPGMNSTIHFLEARYVILENIAGPLVDFRPVAAGTDMHHAAVRHCSVRGSGASVGGNAYNIWNDNFLDTIHNFVIWSNTVSKLGDWQGPDETDNCGVYVDARVTNIWVLDNTFFQLGGDGVAGGHGAGFTSHHFYIGRNKLYQCRENGVDIKQINDVIISENEIWDMHVPAVNTTSQGEGIVTHYYPTNFWFLFNHIHHCDYGIFASEITGGYSIGNVIHDIGHPANAQGWPSSAFSFGGAILYSGVGKGVIIGNTIYNYEKGIQIPDSRPLVIYNNLFVNRVINNGYEFLMPYEELIATTWMDYNFYYPGGGQVERIGLGSTAGGTVAGLAALGIAGFGQNQRSGPDPLLVSVAGSTRLQNGSAAIGAGMPGNMTMPAGLQSPFGLFQQRYGMDIAKDIAGRPRPAIARWDVGANQFQAVAGTPPRAPVNVRTNGAAVATVGK